MFNASVVAGLIGCVLIQESKLHTNKSAPSFSELLGRYLPWSVPITLLALTTFYAYGFYTRGRAYRGKFKVLIVAQAITVVFLVLSAVSYFLRVGVPIPRSAMATTWVIAVIMLAGSRVWLKIWRFLLDRERLQVGEPSLRTDAPTILVIGGAGYIGSALLPKLLERGHKVRLFDLFMYGEEPVANVLGHENLEVVRGDFRQLDKIVKSMDGIDVVIHIGAIVGDPACALDESFTIEVNLTATRMIAEVAKARGVERFIFASTCSVYGASEEVLDERSALRPMSLYARSKVASEKVLASLNSDRFATTILRFGTVYGLSGRPRFDLVVNLLTAKALVDGKVTVLGPDHWRPFVHVDDTASAIVAVLDAGIELVRGQIFNVGSEEQNKTLGELGLMIQKQIPSAEYTTTSGENDSRSYRVRFAKITQWLGFEPNWTLEAGIAQVVNAFRDGRVSDYRDDRYSNAQFLSNQEGQKYFTADVAWMNPEADLGFRMREAGHSQDHLTVR
jgi:nucleoside-diphosphate-sugar epimerase